MENNFIKKNHREFVGRRRETDKAKNVSVVFTCAIEHLKKIVGAYFKSSCGFLNEHESLSSVNYTTLAHFVYDTVYE